MKIGYRYSAGLLGACAAAALVGAIAARRHHGDAAGTVVATLASQTSADQNPTADIPAATEPTPEAPPEPATTTVEEAPPPPDTADLDPDESTDDPEVAAGLAELERLREIPGAAQLVDDIVEYLENGDPSDFSLGNLPVDEHGMATIDDHYLDKMIKDPVIREKWKKLMELEAEAAH